MPTLLYPRQNSVVRAALFTAALMSRLKRAAEDGQGLMPPHQFDRSGRIFSTPSK